MESKNTGITTGDNVNVENKNSVIFVLPNGAIGMNVPDGMTVDDPSGKQILRVLYAIAEGNEIGAGTIPDTKDKWEDIKTSFVPLSQTEVQSLLPAAPDSSVILLEMSPECVMWVGQHAKDGFKNIDQLDQVTRKMCRIVDRLLEMETNGTLNELDRRIESMCGPLSGSSLSVVKCAYRISEGFSGTPQSSMYFVLDESGYVEVIVDPMSLDESRGITKQQLIVVYITAIFTVSEYKKMVEAFLTAEDSPEYHKVEPNIVDIENINIPPTMRENVHPGCAYIEVLSTSSVSFNCVPDDMGVINEDVIPAFSLILYTLRNTEVQRVLYESLITIFGIETFTFQQLMNNVLTLQAQERLVGSVVASIGGMGVGGGSTH